jgi:hypothetical protein
MNSQAVIPVRIESVHGRTSAGTVDLRIWEKSERTRRGLKALGIAWGIALCSVLIPILHFILVPTFLLAGPVAFVWVAAREREILGGQGVCPECGKPLPIVRAPVRWPLSDMCAACQSTLKIEPATPLT